MRILDGNQITNKYRDVGQWLGHLVWGEGIFAGSSPAIPTNFIISCLGVEESGFPRCIWNAEFHASSNLVTQTGTTVWIHMCIRIVNMFRSDSVSPDQISVYKSSDLVPLICRHCSVPFHKTKNRVMVALKHGRSMYCTASCKADWLKSQRVRTRCRQCDCEIDVTASVLAKSKSGWVFCSGSCSAQHSNRTRKTNRSRAPGVCLWCAGTTQESRPYCSHNCFQAKEWDARKKKIETCGGFESENRRIARKYLIEKFGHRCTLCSITEWHGHPVPLVCDHIDGNSENNRLDNLRMVCQNCNALLPTFGSRNRGHGRKSKREAYHRNKLTL